MSDVTRMVLLVVFNSALMLVFVVACAVGQWDIEHLRLVDLEFSKPQDLALMLAYTALVLVAVIGDIALFTWPSSRDRTIRSLIEKLS